MTNNTAIQTYQQFSSEQQEMLAQPLNADLIKHRPGARGLLKYIKGDSAIDAANRIFGFGRWSYKVVARSHEVIEDAKKGHMEFYTADIELSVVGAAFPFPGDGVGIVTEPFTVEMHEKARKEAVTDAIKRALRHYGDQFGLCLYNEDDYVDAGDGTMIQVKDVKPGNQQSARRVVDAEPARQLPQRPQPQPQTHLTVQAHGQSNPQANGQEPASVSPEGQSVTLPTVQELQARCEALYGVGKWEDAKRKLGINRSDEAWTDGDRSKIAKALHNAETKAAQRKQASAA